MLVKRSPLTRAEVRKLDAWVSSKSTGRPGVAIPAYGWIGLPMGGRVTAMYSPPPATVATTPYYEALAAGRVDEFVENAVLDLAPPVDDRPFFFFERPGDALAASMPWAEESSSRGVRTLRSVHVLLLQLASVSALFILAPLVVARRRGLRAPGAGRAIVYFVCLGAGFMFAEIGLIQRFVLLLGHQSYSVTVVLLGLLVGASIGSSVSSRLPVDRSGPLAGVFVSLVALILLYTYGLDHLFLAVAGTSFMVRLALALVVLVALLLLAVALYLLALFVSPVGRGLPCEDGSSL